MEFVFGLSILLYLLYRLVNRPINGGTELTPSHKLTEYRVSRTLQHLDPKTYVVFDNLVLPSRKGNPYTEIDHVVVSSYGIWCIETKSHKGNIYGYSNNPRWSQYIGRQRFEFGNPERQNFKHRQALRDALGFDLDIPIHSLIVFPNANIVKVDGKKVDCSIDSAFRKITKVQGRMFDRSRCETILQTLGHYDRIKPHLTQKHLEAIAA